MNTAQTDYNLIPGWNWSRLRAGLRSMAHLKHSLDTPREDSPAMAMGRLAHMAILEPTRFQNCLIAPALDRRTKDGKAAWLEFQIASEGRDWATAEDHDNASNIAMSVFCHTGASAILRDCVNVEEIRTAEVELPSGRRIKLKGRADAVAVDGGHIADIKTCRDARLPRFAWHARDLGYFHQMAFYRFLFQGPTGLPKMSIIAVESDAPHGVMVYELDPATLDAAWLEIESLLERVLDCEASGVWPGYPGEIATLASEFKTSEGGE